MDLRSSSKRKHGEEESDLRPPKSNIMVHLDVAKTLHKFSRYEAKNAERAGSMSENKNTDENHADSDISTVDEDSESDEEVISGSAQTHNVFNLAGLASVMDDGLSSTSDITTVSSKGQGSLVQTADHRMKERKREKYKTLESYSVKSLQRATFLLGKAQNAVSENDHTRLKNMKREEKEDQIWNDNIARVGLSREGVPIVYSLPRLLLAPDQDRLFEVLMQMGQNVKLAIGGADLNGRNAAESYIKREGELVGCIKLVKLWHAIGHSNEEPTISADFIKSASQFSTTMAAVAEMRSLSLVVNKVLETIDKNQFEALESLHTRICQRYPVVEALSSIDPLKMEGRAIMYNRKTPSHIDRLDPLRSWATMITFGEFKEGGECYIKRLRLRLRYLPGDAIVIRGRILPHEVEEWGAGQRISIAHFTHTSLWKSEKMDCP